MNPTDWFVCPQARPQAEARLFIFPYAGGAPAAFAKWSAEHIEIWTAHYPGRGSKFKEIPIKELLTLVQGLSKTIQPLLNKPFALFGHSMGGLVAFELARGLRRQAQPQPRSLFVSACGAPHMPDPHPRIHSLPDPEFLTELEKFNGIPSEILQNREVLHLLLPAVRADFEAFETYQYTAEEPLAFPIIAFGGLDDRRVSRERLEGWATQTTLRFESHYFDGDHFFINTARESILEKITHAIG